MTPEPLVRVVLIRPRIKDCLLNDGGVDRLLGGLDNAWDAATDASLA